MATALHEGEIKAKGAALLASPLKIDCNPALRTALGLERSISSPFETAFGVPEAPLKSASNVWRSELTQWCNTGRSVDLTEEKTPRWHAASGLDNIAPPESIRSHIGDASFFRVGPLSFHKEEPHHIGMLTHKPTTKALNRWIRRISEKGR